jgi:Skp family chaperone for outer membrane proteins
MMTAIGLKQNKKHVGGNMKNNWGPKSMGLGNNRSLWSIRGIVAFGLVVFALQNADAATKRANVSSSKNASASKITSSNCADLVNDLQTMKKAEKSLMQTMVNRSDAMADTLNKYADDFNELKSQNKKIERKEILSLRRTAETFKDHKQREEVLVQRYQKASDQLLREVASCLGATSVAEASR